MDLQLRGKLALAFNAGPLASAPTCSSLCIAVKRLAVLHSGWDLFDVGVTFLSLSPNVGAPSALRVLRVVRV